MRVLLQAFERSAGALRGVTAVLFRSEMADVIVRVSYFLSAILLSLATTLTTYDGIILANQQIAHSMPTWLFSSAIVLAFWISTFLFWSLLYRFINPLTPSTISQADSSSYRSQRARAYTALALVMVVYAPLCFFASTKYSALSISAEQSTKANMADVIDKLSNGYQKLAALNSDFLSSVSVRLVALEAKIREVMEKEKVYKGQGRHWEASRTMRSEVVNLHGIVSSETERLKQEQNLIRRKLHELNAFYATQRGVGDQRSVFGGSTDGRWGEVPSVSGSVGDLINRARIRVQGGTAASPVPVSDNDRGQADSIEFQAYRATFRNLVLDLREMLLRHDIASVVNLAAYVNNQFATQRAILQQGVDLVQRAQDSIGASEPEEERAARQAYLQRMTDTIDEIDEFRRLVKTWSNEPSTDGDGGFVRGAAIVKNVDLIREDIRKLQLYELSEAIFRYPSYEGWGVAIWVDFFLIVVFLYAAFRDYPLRMRGLMGPGSSGLRDNSAET